MGHIFIILPIYWQKSYRFGRTNLLFWHVGEEKRPKYKVIFRDNSSSSEGSSPVEYNVNSLVYDGLICIAFCPSVTLAKFRLENNVSWSLLASFWPIVRSNPPHPQVINSERSLGRYIPGMMLKYVKVGIFYCSSISFIIKQGEHTNPLRHTRGDQTSKA